MLAPGRYGISFIVYDTPDDCSFEAIKAKPFYSNYAVWNAAVEVVAGTEFTATMSPAKDVYNAGESVTVNWGVNAAYFGADSRVRIKMSDDYGKSFDYVLAESLPASEGSCNVVLPGVNVGDVQVDFITAVRSMPGGIIRVEEIGGAAYAVTALSPEAGGCFNVTGGAETSIAVQRHDCAADCLYDLQGRRVNNPTAGVYIAGTRKILLK